MTLNKNILNKVKQKIIIGTWPFSGQLGKIDIKEVILAIDRCSELGFNVFDTAPNYGAGFCESLLGRATNKEIKINSKIGNSANDGKDFSIKSLSKSFDETLKRLQRNSLHTLFLHNPRSEIRDYDPIFMFFEELKAAGKIKYSGISLARNFKYGDELNFFDVVQGDYNILYQQDKYINNKRFNFHARSILATGILSGKLTVNTKFNKNDYRSSWLKDDRLKSILKRISILKDLSNIALPSLARRFVLFDNRIDNLVLGLKNSKQVNDIYQDIVNGPLEDQLVITINDLYQIDFGLKNQKNLSF